MWHTKPNNNKRPADNVRQVLQKDLADGGFTLGSTGFDKCRVVWADEKSARKTSKSKMESVTISSFS